MLFLGHALLEDENKVWHLVRPVDEVDEGKSKRGSMKEKERSKAITEIYLTRLLSVKVGLSISLLYGAFRKAVILPCAVQENKMISCLVIILTEILKVCYAFTNFVFSTSSNNVPLGRLLERKIREGIFPTGS